MRCFLLVYCVLAGSVGSEVHGTFCFTLGDGSGSVVGVTFSNASFTGGDGTCAVGDNGSCMVEGATLDGSARTGLSVARFKICASWMYALVVFDPYCSDGMLRLGSCRMARMSVAA